ncbi:MAG: SPOR domain-containing protein [Candidatus Zixiibacteriota bacterium]
MKAKATIVFAILLLFVSVPCWGNAIADALANGDFERAGQALDSLVTTEAIGRAEQAYWEGILAESADESIRLLNDAISLGLEASLKEEAWARITEYRLLTGDSLQSSSASTDQEEASISNVSLNTLRIHAAFLERDQLFDSSLKIIDAGLIESRGADLSQWWQIDKARTMLLAGKAVGASKVLKNLTKESKGEGVPIALYLLARESISKKETEKAAHYFNLLRDGYPNAVGTDEIVDRLSEIEEPSATESKAEKVTGTYYSVQVGVFSNPENAERGAEQFRKYKLPVEVVKKRISNVMYNVVYVGHFSEYHEALRTKTMLEENHNESFQVVAR